MEKQLQEKQKAMEAEKKSCRINWTRKGKSEKRCRKNCKRRQSRRKKAKEEEEAKQKAMYASGDKNTLLNAAIQIKNMKVHFSLLTFENIDYKRVMDETCKYLDKVSNYIVENAEKIK